MRSLLAGAIGLFISALVFGAANANSSDDQQGTVAEKATPAADAKTESYRGYFLELSEIAGTPNYRKVVASLHRQIDIAENVGLSSRVLKFFHTVPVVVDEAACLGLVDENKSPVFAAACYGPARTGKFVNTLRSSTLLNGAAQWTNSDPVALAEDTHVGVIMARPGLMRSNKPIILHEMLHAYHADVIPRGFSNPAIEYYYEEAKNKKSYPSDAYLMSNRKEFFAVTASVFLYGQDGDFSRVEIKAKQPEYYKYLSWLFEVDPEQGTPVAFAN